MHLLAPQGERSLPEGFTDEPTWGRYSGPNNSVEPTPKKTRHELPLGTPLQEIIEKRAGGVSTGRPITAIIPGGVSMPVLTADKIGVNMDHDSLQKTGTLLGTGGIVIMDDTTCPVRAATVIARFFRHETCGQCT